MKQVLLDLALGLIYGTIFILIILGIHRLVTLWG